MTKFRSLILTCVALCAVWAFAQVGETGQINGTVTDPQGAVVSGATVTVTNVNTGVSRPPITTGPNGNYAFTNVEPGTYDVKVAAPGFGQFTQRVQVAVGARPTIDAHLKVAASGTTVEVVGAGGVNVETTTQQQSQVVNAQQITQLPTVTRNPYALAATAANVSEGDTANETTRGVGVNINGQRSASTNITLDGGENVDQFNATIGQTVPLDSVQEFQLITSTFDAQYGRASGGVVNVATKSGTNNLHGSVYEFNRNSKFASNTFDNVANGVPKGQFNRNQFGFTLGGPVIRDKAFFFLSGEGLMVRSTASQIALVPTPQFIAASAPATQAFFSNFHLDTPINGPVFTVNDLINTAGVAPGPLLSGLAPTTPILGTVNFRVPQDAGGQVPQNTYLAVGRLDFNLTASTSAFLRYSLQHQFNYPGSVSFSPWAGFNTNEVIHNHNALLSVTHVFSPTLVSTSKVVYNRLTDLQPLSSAGVVPTLFFEDGVPTSLFGHFVYNPGYLPTAPGSGIPFGGPQNVGELMQDFAWTHGIHQLHLGGQFVYTQDNRVFGAYEEASESLGANGDIPGALDNFLAGQLFNFQGAVFPQGKFPCRRDATGAAIPGPDCTISPPFTQPNFSRSNRYRDGAAYVEDSIKLMPRLTVNAGLRWEYYGVQHNVNPNLDSNFYFGSGSNLVQKIANGFVQTAPKSPIGKLWSPSWRNFGPVIGFAWDVFGDGRTSVRGGYRLGFERNFGNVTFNVIQNPPNYAVLSLITGEDIPTDPITANNFGPLSTATAPVILPRTSLRAVRQDVGTAYAHQWNFGLQREVATNTVLSIDYNGSRGLHLYTIENPNRVGTGEIYLGAPFSRINPQYSNINMRGKGGFSYYNALNVQLRSSNLWKTGIQGTLGYTWSHTIDNLSTTFSESTNQFNLGLLDPFNPALDKGNADYDIRHRIIASAIWTIPGFKDQHGVIGQVLGGWQIAPIVEARTGTPFTVWDCTNAFQVCTRWDPGAGVRVPLSVTSSPKPVTGQANVFNGMQMPIDPATGSAIGAGNPADANPVLSPIFGAGNTLGGLFSDIGPSCDAPGSGQLHPCLYPATMTRRNAFRGPGFWNADFGIYKNFKVTERVGLQFRGELFDAFNHHNFWVNGSTVDVSQGSFVQLKKGGLGLPTDERRHVQFALKLNF